MPFFKDHIAPILMGVNAVGRVEAARLVDSLSKAAQAGISGSVVATIDTNKDQIDTPQRAQAIAESFMRQLSHLVAESELQRQKLATKGEHGTLLLEVAIYGLSGMREQLQQSIVDFEQLIAKAQAQANAQHEAAQESAANTTASASTNANAQSATPQPSAVVHEIHGRTCVQEEPAVEPAPSTGWLRKFLGKTPPPLPPNEATARSLDTVYSEFAEQARASVAAFQAAQPDHLRELDMPMDQLRGMVEWLHHKEKTFYVKVAQPVGAPASTTPPSAQP